MIDIEMHIQQQKTVERRPNNVVPQWAKSSKNSLKCIFWQYGTVFWVPN